MSGHFFFDMDNTLTHSRCQIEDEMYAALRKLQKIGDVIIVSGARLKQIHKQIPKFDGFYILAQSGNVAYKDGRYLWIDLLTSEQIRQAICHIAKISQFVDIKPLAETIENRGCQISYSIVGHEAPIEIKKVFDPTGEIRKQLLQEVPLDSDVIEVRIGGTTCLDYTAKGKNKGTNIKKLIERLGWDQNNCLYIGDAIFEGGNDESIIGVCPYYNTSGPEETLGFIEGLLVEEAIE